MTETLRDRLAAVLGPGNDDQTAYAQADAVLDIVGAISVVNVAQEIAFAISTARLGPYPPL